MLASRLLPLAPLHEGSSRRVTDGARNASARLSLTIRNTEVVIERSLRDLTLTNLLIDRKATELEEAAVFQSQIVKLVGVWSFGDWILLLRHMVFYFEDRRALVWDQSAQRQLLRLLLLPADTARTWTEEERAILELDSRMRNLRFALYREEQTLAENAKRVSNRADVRQELQTLEELQETDIVQRERLDNEFLVLDSERQAAVLRHLRAQQERESLHREFERTKLLAIEARFPRHSDSARYILEHLFTEEHCLVCGNDSPLAAALLDKRITENNCIICGADLSELTTLDAAKGTTDREVSRAGRALESIEPELSEASAQLVSTTREFSEAKTKLAKLNAKITERSARINVLIERLPPSEQELHKQRSELAAMRSRVEMLTATLAEKQETFAEFISAQSLLMIRQADAITKSFASFASDFMLESVSLIWSPHKARVGQTGKAILFPAFELDMSGATFPTAVRRTGPEQVSESQREFIDLAFRMSLITVASKQGASSLVLDAPESSLDAVFVGRAANVLARFGNSKGNNRLTITSNLVEGELIPELLRLSAPLGDRISRIVDLFQIAEPTAATREHSDEYRNIMSGLLAKVESTTRESRQSAETTSRTVPSNE